jgi:hypothetical protein
MPARSRGPRSALLALIAATSSLIGCGPERGVGADPPARPTVPRLQPDRKLSHDETLAWIARHRAWRPARKTGRIHARPVAPEEEGKPFQTADHAVETARAGAWLCVGVAGEPWFQAPERVEARYEPTGEEVRAFEFDDRPRTYRIYTPRAEIRNWVARVDAADIEGFFIRRGDDPEHPLYSPAGGYVVRDDTPDPYRDPPDDVWLVQRELFENTYEMLP